MSEWEKIVALHQANQRTISFSKEALVLGEDDGRDASMKRNTAVIRKIRTLSAESVESIMHECRELKMTKYLGEVAGALCEHRLRQASDVALLTEFSSFLYREYHEEWRPHLAARLQVALTPTLEVSRLRTMLRWTFELCLTGVLDDWNWLLKVIKSILVEDDEGGRRVLSVATMLAKYLRDMSLMPEFAQKNFTSILRDYFKAMCRSMVRAQHHFIGLQNAARRFYEQKGDLSAERSEEIKAAHEVFDRMQVSLQSLAEALNETLPKLKAQESDEVEMQEGRMVFKAMVINAGIWETEEDRAFYEDLQVEDEGGTDGMEVLDAAIAQDPDAVVVSAVEELGKSLASLMPRILELHTAEAVDKLAADLIPVMTAKSQRRRFAEQLMEMTKKRIDLLPFVSRMLAIIKPSMPDLIAMVESHLLGQFTFMYHRNGIPILGSRSRICRFIGELTKCRVLRQGVAFACIKRALDSFERYNVDLVCILMESCGRFLLHQPESAKRIQLVMETMQRKKEAMLTLQSNQIIMIENALYTVNPPCSDGSLQFEQPSAEEHFLALVLDMPVGKALPLLRRFPPQVAMEGLIAVWRVPYARLSNLASIIIQLPKSVQIPVIDGIIEQLLQGLENPQWPHQRRLAVARVLGLLPLPAQLVDSLVLAILNWGHSPVIRRYADPIDEDAPGDLFRIRLVTLLLQNRKLPDLSLIEYYIAVKLDGRDFTIDHDQILDDFYATQGNPRPKAFDLNRAINNLISVDPRYAFLVEDAESKASAPPSPVPLTPGDSAFEKELSSLIITSLDGRKYERRIEAFDLNPRQLSTSKGKHRPTTVIAPQSGTKILLREKKKS